MKREALGGIAVVIWAILGLVGLLLDCPTCAAGHAYSQVWYGALAVVFGIWAFLRIGGRTITASGLYCLASSVFVGAAALWWHAQMTHIPDNIYVATATGWWTTFIMYALFWHKPLPESQTVTVDPNIAEWGL